MSKTVLLCRHGKSDAAILGGTDHDRTLNERGRVEVGLVGDSCKKRGLRIDRIVSSTAVRAYSTTVLFAQRFGYHLNQIQLESGLYLAEPRGYVDAIIQHSQMGQVACDAIMLVGHNPSISELASAWSGTDASLPTAALAHIELEIDDWNELRTNSPGRLIQMLIPREL